MRIPFEELRITLKGILEKHGMDGEDADLSSFLFASSSADGVHTHGLNRFPSYISLIDRGLIDVRRKAVFESRFGAIERWDGQRGPGDINAWRAMRRAVELSRENGVGIVALRNTNHWMRAGNYGLEAVKMGAIGIMWTNTMPNMPAWGGKDPRIGNNPLVIAVPYKDTPVLVDIAMSMFSYGKLGKYILENKECPVDGGFDENGNLTRDPKIISETKEALPIGFWKGSGLAIALDLIASLISGGKTTVEIGKYPIETEVSQIFMAFSLDIFPDKASMETKIGETLEYIKASSPRNGCSIHYPGEGIKNTREESEKLGVFADDSVWKTVLSL